MTVSQSGHLQGVRESDWGVLAKTAVGKGWRLTASRLKSIRIFFLGGSTERGRKARNSSKVKVTFPGL